MKKENRRKKGIGEKKEKGKKRGEKGGECHSHSKYFYVNTLVSLLFSLF